MSNSNLFVKIHENLHNIIADTLQLQYILITRSNSFHRHKNSQSNNQKEIHEIMFAF